MVRNNLQKLNPKASAITLIKSQQMVPEVQAVAAYITLQRDTKYKQLLQYCDGSPEFGIVIGELRAYEELLDLIGKDGNDPARIIVDTK